MNQDGMVSSKFAAAFEESERISAEIAAYNQECAMLRDQIDGIERTIREKTAALHQAGWKPPNPAQASAAAQQKADGSGFSSVPNTQFSTFDSRLKSFRKWPHSAAVRPLATPSSLAAQGFYFSPDEHYKDRVLCAFCNLELAEWGPKDDPVYEHGQRSSSCPVVTGKILAIQTRDPDLLNDIIQEEEAAVSKLQVLQMGMQKQLTQYTDQIKNDKMEREKLDKALTAFRTPLGPG